MSQKRRLTADEPFLDVRSSTGAVRAGERVGNHVHDWHQLVAVTAGLMTVTTEAGAWTAPPHWAIWVPAGVRHAIRFIGPSRFATLYLRPGSAPALPEGCTALAVSPLLAALVERVTAIGMVDRRDAIEAALATLIAAEIRTIPMAPFTLPHPTSDATCRVAALIAEDAPRSPGDGAALARAAGLGLRTLERRFRAETGLTIGQWRRHRLLLRALEHLAAGAPVKAAAATAGYATPSAFVAAFREGFGVTPGRYFAPRDPAPQPQNQPDEPTCESL